MLRVWGARGGVAWLSLAALVGCSDPGVQGGAPIDGEAGLGVSGPPSSGLVFVRSSGGSNELMRARLADGAVAQLTNTRNREERWPYWSQVAGRILYQARPERGRLETHLYLLDPTSGTETRLNPVSAYRSDERWQTWSPVGEVLAYRFADRSDNEIIWRDLGDGRSRVLVRAGRGETVFRPAFAPDGRSLVIQRQTGDAGPQLELIEAGGSSRPLTDDPSILHIKARFTRDGRTILFTRKAGAARPGDLVSLDIETGAQRVFASTPEANDHSPHPSPVRDEAVFVSDRDGTGDIFLVDLPNGKPRNLTHSTDFKESSPRWSPDGELIAIQRIPMSESGGPPSAKWLIVVLDRQGRQIFETTGWMHDWMPAWP